MYCVKQNSSGFTLIEVLVSLVVFSSVVSLVLVGLEQGRLQWDRSMRSTEHSYKLLLRKQWLDQLFSQSNGATFQISYGTEAPHFLGTSTDVSFISNAPIISGPGTYASVNLALEAQNNGLNRLVFKQWPYSDPYLGIPNEATKTNTLVLIEDIQALEWEYYLAPRDEATPWELKYNTFTRRPEGIWAQEYDGRFEQAIPQTVKVIFTRHDKKHVWQFYLPTKTASYSQEARLSVF
ncbi:prepilin-type N-terminal cleavage/methylation domain-containing protein [Vibrio cholerae]|uniref:prepilin-type N-terminal cleavage/methylation domain-containing protein n=1 Tax=Vibrio cholerae TaxID=666 RepID=UPI0001BAD0D6|nr:prepilin-type N-terminal cleavage/methylation domain-containing protein [Vibrio cholerae]EEY50293.1 S-protein secretion component J [Vibrio cholerae CT 5369-93]MEB5557629.1 prepilin-type N-terminal cleavage/methylation domain-containing protein [Vibrio cholerae]